MYYFFFKKKGTIFLAFVDNLKTVSISDDFQLFFSFFFEKSYLRTFVRVGAFVNGCASDDEFNAILMAADGRNVARKRSG